MTSTISSPASFLMPSVSVPSLSTAPRSQLGSVPVLTATLADGVLVLATEDGAVAVHLPMSRPTPAPCLPGPGTTAPVAVVCALDSALACRLYRRVSAWRPDAQGNLSARVRPAA